MSVALPEERFLVANEDAGTGAVYALTVDGAISIRDNFHIFCL
jgi:hypothetical protein